jgi:DNA polymerase-3 subunit beta
MKFSVTRESLLKPLQLVAGVVERRQTLPVLSNVLIRLQGNKLSLVGTDLEVELVGRITLESAGEDGEVTVPARKLLDICRSLPESANINFFTEGQKIIIKSGKSRFTLSTLSATDFPSIEDSPSAVELTIQQKQLKRLIDRTAFSMAQQDVRYYLNGMLFELKPGHIRTVATDGHRLALCTHSINTSAQNTHHAILPRKGVMELLKLLTDADGDVRLLFGNSHIRAFLTDFTFTSKLVDGKFPDYDRVLPKGGTKRVQADREQLRLAFSRTAILSNEKYRGVRLHLTSGLLTMVANNPEQEEAEEQMSVDYAGESLEIGFNVSYLVDVLGVLAGEKALMTLSDPNSSVLLEESEEGDSVYVVMPMRL